MIVMVYIRERKNFKMKPINKITLLALTIVLASCSDAEKSAMSAWGQKHRVKMFSGGQVVGEWTSTGKIVNESNSDGYYFKDDKTGKMVTVCGDVTITVE